jgi:hypothetical protein
VEEIMAKRIAITVATLALSLTAVAQQETQATNQATGKVNMTVNVAPMPALPMGTAVKMKLETILSTVANKAGDPFAGRVTQDVAMNGKVVIPVGSSIQGHVVRVNAERRYKGLPSLELHPDQVITPNGDKYTLNAVVVDTDKASQTKVDDEGHIKGAGIDGRDKMEMAVGAGAGAGLGALVTHSGTGALIGGVVGGTSAVVYWLTKHKSATLPPGTEIVMELSRPMTLNAAGD